MKNIKEYAESKNISCEAVRKKVRLYRDELGEHIYKKGRAQYLDDTAIQFLDEHSIEKNIVIYDAKKDEEIKGLQIENKQLQQQLIKIQQDYLQSQEHAHALELEKLRIEGAREQAEEKIKQLQGRRLTFRERFFGRLEITETED